MGLFKYQTFLAGTTVQGSADSTNYCTYPINGILRAVICTTSTGLLSTGLTTPTTGKVSTTANMLFKTEKTLQTLFAIPVPAAGFGPVVPQVRSISTSGGVIGVGTTDTFCWYEFLPIAEERIIVGTSGGSSASCTGGYTYNITLVIEGAQREN
jgi:hypothetical protein